MRSLLGAVATFIGSMTPVVAHAQLPTQEMMQECASLPDVDQLIACWSRQIERNPGLAGLYVHRAGGYRKKGESEKAIQDYSTALQLLPRYAVALNLRGEEYARIRKEEKALADFKAALAINPNYEAARNNLQKLENGKSPNDIADRLAKAGLLGDWGADCGAARQQIYRGDHGTAFSRNLDVSSGKAGIGAKITAIDLVGSDRVKLSMAGNGNGFAHAIYRVLGSHLQLIDLRDSQAGVIVENGRTKAGSEQPPMARCDGNERSLNLAAINPQSRPTMPAPPKKSDPPSAGLKPGVYVSTDVTCDDASMATSLNFDGKRFTGSKNYCLEVASPASGGILKLKACRRSAEDPDAGPAAFRSIRGITRCS